MRRLARILGDALERIDGALDRIPWRFSDDSGERRWGPSCWGCYPLRLHRLWDPLQEYGRRG